MVVLRPWSWLGALLAVVSTSSARDEIDVDDGVKSIAVCIDSLAICIRRTNEM